MPDMSKRKGKTRNFSNDSFFVCGCSGCGRKQDIFSDKISERYFCDVCGEKLDFTRFGFEIPDHQNKEETP